MWSWTRKMNPSTAKCRQEVSPSPGRMRSKQHSPQWWGNCWKIDFHKRSSVESCCFWTTFRFANMNKLQRLENLIHSLCLVSMFTSKQYFHEILFLSFWNKIGSVQIKKTKMVKCTNSWCCYKLNYIQRLYPKYSSCGFLEM